MTTVNRSQICPTLASFLNFARGKEIIQALKVSHFRQFVFIFSDGLAVTA